MKTKRLSKALLCLAVCFAAVLILSIHFNLPWQEPPKPTQLQTYLQQLLNTTEPVKVTEPSNTKLTINPGIEGVLKTYVYNRMISSNSKWSTAVMMNLNSGAVVGLTSLANPNRSICRSYDRCAQPMQDAAVVSWEPGSDFKPLLLSAAFNIGVLKPSSRYFDSGHAYVDERLFIDADHYSPRVMSMQNILSYSLNTGAIHVLKTIGGGAVDKTAMDVWYNYLINHYHFDVKTGLGLYGESAGTVRPPSGGRDLAIQYTSSAFGVGEAVTPIQLVAAYASIINGGTYYAPHILAGTPKVVSSNVVSRKVSSEIVGMLHQTLVFNEKAALISGYDVGAKTGTAPVPSSNGSYEVYANNGTYIGFIGKTKPEYILLIRFDKPKTPGFASAVPRELWPKLTKALINDKLI